MVPKTARGQALPAALACSTCDHAMGAPCTVSVRTAPIPHVLL